MVNGYVYIYVYMYIYIYVYIYNICICTYIYVKYKYTHGLCYVWSWALLVTAMLMTAYNEFQIMSANVSLHFHSWVSYWWRKWKDIFTLNSLSGCDKHTDTLMLWHCSKYVYTHTRVFVYAYIHKSTINTCLCTYIRVATRLSVYINIETSV